MPVLGNGLDTTRYTAEIAVRGTIAYTTSWSVRRVQGNKVNIWDVSGDVSGARRLADRHRRDDDGRRRGERRRQSARRRDGAQPAARSSIYDLAESAATRSSLSRFTNDQTTPGVHTAELGRVNGKLYAFLAIDPSWRTAQHGS